MTDTTPPKTVNEVIQARLLALATRCLQGELNLGALAREAFLVGLKVGRAECRAKHGNGNEGTDHEGN